MIQNLTVIPAHRTQKHQFLWFLFQKNKRPTGTGSQSDAPPTYQEALLHDTATTRAAMVQAHNSEVEVHKSPPRTSAPSENPPPVPLAPYPEQLAVPSGYQPPHGVQRSPHSPYSPQDSSHGKPHSPRDIPNTPRGMSHPQEGYPTHQGHSSFAPVQRSPYQQSATPSQYDPSEFQERQNLNAHSPGYSASYYSQTSTEPSAHGYNRARSVESHGHPRDYARNRSQPEPPYNPDYTRSGSQEIRDYPHLMTSHPTLDNEYTHPPVPARNYSLDDDDDGGFGAQSSRNRRALSSSSHTNVPRDYVDYRSHDQYPMRPSGDDEVDYAGYSQIPPRSLRNQPYSPTSESYQNEAFIGDTRMPGDGAYIRQGQSQGHRGQGNDTGQSPYYSQRGPLPPLPQQDNRHHSDSRMQAHYNTQQGVVFPHTDRRYMDSDTYI